MGHVWQQVMGSSNLTQGLPPRFLTINSVFYSFFDASGQATIDARFRNIGLAMSRDFTGLMVHLNDFVMHLHNSLGSPGYLAPEFKAEKARST